MCAWKGTRPPAVTERDQTVLVHLKSHGPLTRNDIAEQLDLPPSLTYLSLDRLRVAKLVKRCISEDSNYTLWTSAVDQPCK